MSYTPDAGMDRDDPIENFTDDEEATTVSFEIGSGGDTTESEDLSEEEEVFYWQHQHVEVIIISSDDEPEPSPPACT